jgi:hypothetical protein
MSPEEDQMPSRTRLDTDKLRIRRIVATAGISVVAIAFLLFIDGLRQESVPLSGSRGQALDVAAPAEAVQLPLDQARRAAVAAVGVPDDPAVAQNALSEPGVAAEPEAAAPAATEQRVYKARRALETIDPRDFLRQSALPK